MAVFPVVKGVRLRATKINSCGQPIAGAANRIVTDGFVSFKLTPQMKDAEELEQVNAEGKVCVTDRTPPERKWYNIEAVLCNVNTGLISMFNGWEQVLDYKDVPVGFRDASEVDGDYGVALEVWTGGSSEDDCPVPLNDDVLTQGGSGKSYGYFLVGGKEFQLGDIEISAAVSTFTLTGISVGMPQWGRGPYNVVPIDDAGTAGRLLVPLGSDEHFTVQRTSIAPPPITPGGDPLPLEIATLFVDPDFYYGGPASEPAADIAPAQPSDATIKAYGWSVSVTGTGTYTYTVDGTPTSPLTEASTVAEIETALNAAGTTAGFDVAGTSLSYTIHTDNGSVLSVDGTGMVGGGVQLTVTE